MSLEAVDPHSTVTFLSFACSGATISQPYFGDQSSFDPYRPPPGQTQPRGAGILGPYIGTEPPMLNGAVATRSSCPPRSTSCSGRSPTTASCRPGTSPP